VTETGTLPDVSPRRANELTDETVEKLRAARAEWKRSHDAADATFRAVVRQALTEGSVRRVADAADLSPTTVQAWSRE
jgi:hypothetical protein